MKLIHFSDIHGKLPKLPRKNIEDAYFVFSGDICPNNIANFIPGIKSGDKFIPTSWNTFWNFRQIDIKAEEAFQNKWIEEKLLPHFKNIDLNKIIILRGNHDWADFEKYFKLSLNQGSKNIEIDGIKIGLLTGVLPYSGEWNDEIYEYDINERLLNLNRDIEILISHVPTYGILDKYAGGDHIGSQAIYNMIFGYSEPLFKSLKLHLFGHMHEARGAKKINDIKFYNAAQTRFIIEFKK